MKNFFIFALGFFLLSCENNPLGKTSLSTCNYSPGVNVGLPLTCQVNIPFTENLFAWLDAHDSGTVNLQDQTNVIRWVDKSGNGASLNFASGTEASPKKQSSNQRNSILFESTTGVYTSAGGLLNFPADQSFTLALSLKTPVALGGVLSITNLSDFSLNISTSNFLSVSFGGVSDLSTGITLTNNKVHKYIFSYNTVSSVLIGYDGVSQVFSGVISGARDPWTDLSIESSGNFEINEVLIYTDLVDVSALQNYLNSKWGF